MAITNSEMQDYARRAMRDRVGGKANSIINEAINSALVMIAKDMGGPYYLETASLNIYGSYDTGTIAISNGGTTVTLTGGTFPSDLDSTWEIRTGGQYYTIASRDSDTTLTLNNAWHLDALTASTYVVYKDNYALAGDMLQMGERIYFGRDWPYGPDPIAYSSLLNYKEGDGSGSTHPNVWAIRKASAYVSPWPTSNQVVNYHYIRCPTKVTFDQSTNLDIDDQHEDLLECAIDYQLSKRGVGILSLNEAYGIYNDMVTKSQGNERQASTRPASKWIRGVRYYHARTLDVDS